MFLPTHQKDGQNPHMPNLDHHRRRQLRDRFLSGGIKSIDDYEQLELLLYLAIPRADVKPLAKQLLKTFKSFQNICRAPIAALENIPGIGPQTISAIKILHSLASTLGYEELIAYPMIQHSDQLVRYCRLKLDNPHIEQIIALFLNDKHCLIKDEVHQRGTHDKAPLYPREILKSALNCGAYGLIIAHNHPMGPATPSESDIKITQRIHDAVNAVDIALVDHLIISPNGHYSFREAALL